MTRDLTSGNPMKLIFEFGIPTMLGMLFQQLYMMVDTAIVGKLIGPDALASVGSTGPINFLVIGSCMGLCSGFAIPVAQALGAGDMSKMRRCAIHSGYLSIAYAAVITFLTCFFCSDILVAMNTPADIMEGAYNYIFVIFAGIPACFLYNMTAGVIRSLGDSRTPVYFLGFSSLLNIALDFLFIVFLQSGVAGAAIATVISQGVSGVICLWYMTRNYSDLHASGAEFVPQLPITLELNRAGLPMGLQYSITAIGSVVLQTAVNGLGTLAVTAVATAWKVLPVFNIVFDALGATMATYCGQNLGARKLGRLGEGIWASCIIAFWYSLGAMIFLQFFARHACLIFLNADAVEILDMATKYIRITYYFAFPLALVNIVRFAIQGMGFSNLAMLAGVTEMVCRVVAGRWLVPMFGFNGAISASPTAWIMADIFLIPAALWCISRLRRDLGIPRGSELDIP